MGAMKDFDIRIRNGGDDAIAAVNEYVKELEGEVACARACAEMMLQGTGQKLGEEWARRVMDEHYSPRWIPVSERLPEDGTWCWVDWDGPGKPFPAMRDSRSAGGWTNTDCWEDFDREVTHWMPLPEPPEVK